MSGYIFKMPAVAYELPFTFESLESYLQKGKAKISRKVGETVEIRQPFKDTIQVKLYDTVIARIYRDGELQISESVNEYPRLATTAWVQKVLSDNKVGGWVARKDFKYAQAGKFFQRNI
ncbi:hypothetical protein SEA_ATUIN_317 [Arthrobacter phage Atuin]|nr:hypothetical protein SEA_ATUIN_116 [Arthrobacter phage Atuin]